MIEDTILTEVKELIEMYGEEATLMEIYDDLKCDDVLTICNEVEKQFNIHFNHIDGNILNIHSSDFDYAIIEYIEDRFDIDVEFYFVHDDTTFVDIELDI